MIERSPAGPADGGDEREDRADGRREKTAADEQQEPGHRGGGVGESDAVVDGVVLPGRSVDAGDQTLVRIPELHGRDGVVSSQVAVAERAAVQVRRSGFPRHAGQTRELLTLLASMTGW